MRNEFHKNVIRLFKQLLVLTIVFSIFLTLILVPIRFGYHEEAPWKETKYNIFVNGPITKNDYLNITKDPNIVNAAVTNYGSGEVYKGNVYDKFVRRRFQLMQSNKS